MSPRSGDHPAAAETVQACVEAPIARLTLARPQNRNALSAELLDDLAAAAARAAADTSVKVIVIAAQGPVFSSGHDLRELLAGGTPDHEAVFASCRRAMEGLRALPVPVIAEVDGLATAAGCQLVASCDLAVASDRAAFATPGVRIGLFCSTPMVPLTAVIGPRRALEMLLTGEPVDAATALSWGLVNRVVPVADLTSATDALAAAIAASSREVVALGKRAFYAQVGRPEVDAYDITTPIMVDNASNDAAREGIGAFLEKRPPRWPGG
ncbi:MAG: enoyl-CoA hydratase [Acidimicrobiales bacterium]